MYLKPTAGFQISTLIFENKLWSGKLYKYRMKNISRTAKFFLSLAYIIIHVCVKLKGGSPGFATGAIRIRISVLSCA